MRIDIVIDIAPTIPKYSALSRMKLTLSILARFRINIASLKYL